jgi:cyclic pyranopterin phosphate synthase
MNELSHIDVEGKARMVDVGDKPVQKRTAIAVGHISLLPETIKLVKENQMKKGDVLGIAQIAGIQAAKQTSSLIPLCHPLLLTSVKVVCKIDESGVNVRSTVICSGQTGVEMEALTAVSVALLTMYDMCKAVDKQMVISEITLVEKTKM